MNRSFFFIFLSIFACMGTHAFAGCPDEEQEDAAFFFAKKSCNEDSSFAFRNSCNFGVTEAYFKSTELACSGEQVLRHSERFCAQLPEAAEADACVRGFRYYLKALSEN